MFHWICPECGREIAPAVRECPACDPQAAVTLAVESAVARSTGAEVALTQPEPQSPEIAVQPEREVSVALEEPEPPAAVLPAMPTDAIGAAIEPAVEAQTVEHEPPPIAAEVLPDESVPMEPESMPVNTEAIAAESDLSTGPPADEAGWPAFPDDDDDLPTLELEIPAPAEQPAEEPEPAVMAVAPAEPEPLAAPEAPAEEPATLPYLEAAPAEPSPALVEESAPEPEPAIAAALPDLAPDPLLILALKLRQEQQAPEETPIAACEPEPEPQPDAVTAPVALLAAPEPPEAPEAPEEEISAPTAVALAVPGCEPVALPERPPADPEPISEPRRSSEGQIPTKGAAWARPTLPSGGLIEYSVAARRQIHPVAPRATILTPDSGPRITLPGPALPPQLNSLQAAGLARILIDRPPKPPGKSSHGWLVSLVVMMAMLLLGVVVLFALLPHPPAATQTAGPQEVQAAEAAPPTPAVTPVSYPLSKSVEVTGFRFLVDTSKRAEVHYLVVNHSAAELSDLTVFVTLHAGNSKAGQPPLCRFSFRPAGLAPYESKEMVSAIQKLPTGIPLPDWQDLKADVELAQ